MKKYILLFLLGAVFFIATACPAVAEEPYHRVLIPATGLSVAVQPLKLGEEPNHVTAWVYDLWPQAIFMHRDGPGAELDHLGSGDDVFLHRDWGADDRPLRLQITRIQIIAAEDEDRIVLDRVGGNIFALITCHPAGDPRAPQRLVVWAVVDRPRRAHRWK